LVGRFGIGGVVLALAACGSVSQGWSGPVTDVTCNRAGATVGQFVAIDVHFAPGATAQPSPADLASEPGLKEIINQPDPSAAARVAESYGWSCTISAP
jgi:hypothetical protein